METTTAPLPPRLSGSGEGSARFVLICAASGTERPFVGGTGYKPMFLLNLAQFVFQLFFAFVQRLETKLPAR
jgi:hypothetical protein